mgnify:CR=1 FL=1
MALVQGSPEVQYGGGKGLRFMISSYRGLTIRKLVDVVAKEVEAGDGDDDADVGKEKLARFALPAVL